jgi:tellurite resistance protein TerC
MKHIFFRTLAQAKRVIVIVVGFTVLAVGIAMIVLPGPAVVVIPIGLTILATEFLWARKLLDRVKERIDRMRKRRTS